MSYKKCFLALAMIIFLLFAGQQSVTAGDDSDPPTPTTDPGQEQLVLPTQSMKSGKTRVSYHAKTGKVRFLSGVEGHSIQQPSALPQDVSPEMAARTFLSEYGSMFGITNQSQELTVRKEMSSSRGRTGVRFQQVFQDIPVFGGELIVQMDAAKNVLSANGEVLPKIKVDTNPTINSSQARQTAKQLIIKLYEIDDPSNLKVSSPELWLYNPILVGPGENETSLVWRIEVTTVNLGTIHELVLIDAHDGLVDLHFNTVPLSRNRETYNMNNQGDPTDLSGLPGSLVCDESDPSCTSGDTHAQNAHIFSGNTYDFYAANHGRDSVDDAGMTLKSSVHFYSNYCNAFWSADKEQMVYGDGCFIIADDVVAHEMTHGVTDFESQLFYYYQSGAINEAFSDIWGEFVDLTNGVGDDAPSVRWQIGEDTSVGTFRDMQDPTSYGLPDKMSSSYYDEDEYFDDYGGVHTNNGVGLKAAYLMTDGDTFNGYEVTGLGMTKTAKIFYEVQTNLLTSGSDYGDLYDALYQACQNLIGVEGITQSDCQEVRDATDAVEMNQPPNTSTYNPPEAPVCGTDLVPNHLFFDDMESSGNWDHGYNTGDSTWQGLPLYAHSDLYSLYSEDQNFITDSYALMNLDVSLPENSQPYLHFSHSYWFEHDGVYAYDGSVIEYSTDSGSTWQDAGSLIDHNGYRGLIDNDFDNPLGGRQGFGFSSHGYISTRLDLSSLASQDVRFRWRIGTDSSNVFNNLGWFVDDVMIYTCVPEKKPPADFDGDGDTDVSVFRPSNGKWYINGESPVWWGLAGDIPVPGDYDGDGSADLAVFRPSNGKWYVYGEVGVWWGMPDDVPVHGDYDGDGSTDLAVFRPSNGKWYVYGEAGVWWGMPGDIPVPGDYDGDGSTDIAVYRPSNGKWYVYGESGVWWGMPDDIPVPGDYDGDGSTDIAVYRPSNGKWFVYGEAGVWWGMPDDIPVPGDYDGNGSTDIAVLRPSNGKWYIKEQMNLWYYLPDDYPLPVRDTNADGDPYQ